MFFARAVEEGGFALPLSVVFGYSPQHNFTMVSGQEKIPYLRTVRVGTCELRLCRSRKKHIALEKMILWRGYTRAQFCALRRGWWDGLSRLTAIVSTQESVHEFWFAYTVAGPIRSPLWSSTCDLIMVAYSSLRHLKACHTSGGGCLLAAAASVTLVGMEGWGR